MIVQIALVCSILLLLLARSASAHLPLEVLYCPAFAEVSITRIPVRLNTTVTENGLFAELYDVNGDKKVDVVTYSALDGGAVEFQSFEPLHKDIPIFYEVDEDNDQTADAIYIDSRGEQKCEDIVEYTDELASKGSLM